MKTLYKLFFLGFIVVSIWGCDDEYFDVNTPNGGATEEQVRMNDLLAPVIYRTIYAQYWAERSVGNYSQYFTGQGGGAAGPSSSSGTWSNSYLYVFPNVNLIIEKADALNANHFKGVAQVIKAINIAFIADMYSNAPYSQASQGSADLRPAFDTQQEIYNSLFALLDDAIANLSAADNSGISPSSNDIIYGGEIDKWLRAAYTLRGRYTMHLSEVNGSAAAATEALSYLNNGFTSNDDDFQMLFSAEELNPWHSRQVLAPNTGNDHDKIADQLVSYMDGTYYELDGISIDPRLPVYADKDADASAPWRGYETGGNGLSSDGESGNTNFADNGFYTSLDSPIGIISYAEGEFLKAEAEFLKAGGTSTSTGAPAAAYNAYLSGIQANMDKLGVDGADYLAEASIAVGASNLMLNNIMKEKYIANFLNPETFSDFRRYDFSTDVYKGLTLPLDNADSEFPGEWLVRFNYPTSERDRNLENVVANQQSPTTPVWWDQ